MGSFQNSKTRKRFLAKFEERPDGYLYRRVSSARPVRISAKDHKFMVDEFDTAWLQMPFVAVLAVVAFGLAAWLASDFVRVRSTPDYELMLLPLAGIWFAIAWWADLWDKPNQALFDRADEMKRTKGLPWLTRTAGGYSWKGSVIYVFLMLSPLVRNWEKGFQGSLDKFFLALSILDLVLLPMIAIRKRQLNRAHSLPYLNEID